MSENLYEGMFLLDSGQFAADPEGMEQSVNSILEKAGGTVVVQRPWQDGRLAYEIAGRRKALHYLTLFRLPPENVSTLNRSCMLSDKVIRHLFIQQPPTLFDAMVAALTGEGTSEEEPAPAETAPAAAESAPAGDVETKTEETVHSETDA